MQLDHKFTNRHQNQTISVGSRRSPKARSEKVRGQAMARTLQTLSNSSMAIKPEGQTNSNTTGRLEEPAKLLTRNRWNGESNKGTYN